MPTGWLDDYYTTPSDLGEIDRWQALASLCRDEIIDRRIATSQAFEFGS